MQISKLAHSIPLFPKMKRTPQKFWELAGVHMKFLYNMALRYTGNRYDAEDLVQETFYIGFKRMPRIFTSKKRVKKPLCLSSIRLTWTLIWNRTKPTASPKANIRFKFGRKKTWDTPWSKNPNPHPVLSPSNRYS